MLVLTRRKREAVVLSVGKERILVEVLASQGGSVRLGFLAPKHVAIHRREVQERIDREAMRTVWGNVPVE